MSDFIRGAAGLLGAIEQGKAVQAQAKREQEQQAYDRALKKAQMQRQGYQEITDPETGAVEFKPTEQFLKTQEIEKQKQEQEGLLRQQRQQKGMLELEKAQEEKEIGKQLPPPVLERIKTAEDVQSSLPDIENLINENKDQFGPVAGRIGAINPYNTEAQSIDAAIRIQSQEFGKFMEGGVLRKEDEDKYRRMFPNLTDTPETAKNKLNIVKRRLQNKLKSVLSGFEEQGYRTKGFKFPTEITPAYSTPSQQPTTNSVANEMTAADRQALDWARSNLDDPRSKKIMQRLGM